MRKPLTPRQQEILDFIRKYVEEEKKMPSLKLISDHFKVRPPTMCVHMRKLRQKGALAETPPSRILPQTELFACSQQTCPRRIKVIQANGVGLGAEDKFVLAPENLPVICDPSDMIACEMPDDSMFDIGIHCGDVLIGVPAEGMRPRAGDLVIVELATGFTVRTLLSGVGTLKLSAANKEFKEIEHVSKKFKEVHVVVSMIRSF